MEITKPNVYDPADHPEEWTPAIYEMLDKARDIIEEWWLPNRQQLDRLGGVLAMNKHMGNQAFQAIGVCEAAIRQALDYTTTTIMYRDSIVFQLYRTPNIDRKFLASYLVRRRL